MKKKNKIISAIVGTAIVIGGIIAHVSKEKAKKESYSAEIMESIPKRELGIYEAYIKRGLDIFCAMGAMICFSPLYLCIAILVRIKLGSPILFVQERPGIIDKNGKETIFKLFKFRTMTDERDEAGVLLPDEDRITRFGAWLRSTSLDELPEAINILNGTMSVVGPRPQLVRDLVFMNNTQRQRHTAKPGLSGLAQVTGRNSISWDQKIELDLDYLNHISVLEDSRIILKTVEKAFMKKEGITEENHVTTDDYGDYLLKLNRINEQTYESKRREAAIILKRGDARDLQDDLVSIIMPAFNAEKYIKSSIKSVINQTYPNWELLIVDDCSTDNTVNIINSFSDDRIRTLHNDVNSGAAISRNKAIIESKGRWIAFLDSDDLWEPNKLEEQLRFMRQHNYAFTYTDYRIQLNGKWLPYKNTAPNFINRRKLYNYCYFSTITVMYDQSRVGLIQIEDLRKNNDYAMWLQIIERVNCYRLPKCLSYYIKHDGSISSGNKLKLIKWHYILFRKGLNKNPVTSLALTINNMVYGTIKKVWYKEKVDDIPCI